jgi:hypothetical protein
MFPEGSPYTVYSSEEWHGDKWDPMEYGQGIDFDKPFFEQWKELQIKVPRAALLHHQAKTQVIAIWLLNLNLVI